ncbi:DUF2336 domain-containing protein [Kitasatospora putterlickiae]|uniref:DUF2336 domain-containing protein n=1 Tax=Kitasatospora putterlickiae TaxID=221725 RepID=A0ABN1XXR5_9ACTN
MTTVLHPDRVLCGLAANPALPSDLVDRLIALATTTADPSLAEHLAYELTDRDDLGRPHLLTLAAGVEDAATWLAHDGRLTAADVDPATRPEAALALLARGEGPPEWARRFAADPDPRRRERLAACPDLPEDVLRRLAQDPDPEVIAELALTAPPALATELARHPHSAVRRAVAANDRTPPPVLTALLTADHGTAQHETAAAVLAHPATPATAAAPFADHPATPLRAELAARTDLPAELYLRLAHDPEPPVRRALAENPAIGEEVIRTLAADEDGDIARGLVDHPRVPLDVLTRLAARGRAWPRLLPRIASASPAEVAELAASAEPAVRMLVAERRDLPPAIRDALAADPDAKVLKAIAPHPGLPEPLLRAMLTRHAVRVAARIATNPDASPALLTDLAHHRPPVSKALRAIAKHPAAPGPALVACLTDNEASPIAATHPALPPEVLTDLIGGDLPHLAEAAATNPSLPPETARALVTRLAPW